MNYYVNGSHVNGYPCRGINHTIKKGDTLYKLSRTYDVPVADIIWQNPGVQIYNLQIGDTLCIPVYDEDTDEICRGDNCNGNNNTGNMSNVFPYVTHEGESVGDIINMFRMTMEELLALNPDKMMYFDPGTVLNIPLDRILRQS